MFNGSCGHQLIAEETTQLLMRAEGWPMMNSGRPMSRARDASRRDAEDKMHLLQCRPAIKYRPIAALRYHCMDANSCIKAKTT